MSGSNDVLINCNYKVNFEDYAKEYKCYKKYLAKPYYEHICIKCGINYYQLSQETNVECQEIPEGYYVESSDQMKILKKCYSSCKKCDKGGDEAIHNCIECNDNYPIVNHNIKNTKNCYKETIITTEIKIETTLIAEKIKPTTYQIKIKEKTSELISKNTNSNYITEKVQNQNTEKIQDIQKIIKTQIKQESQYIDYKISIPTFLEKDKEIEIEPNKTSINVINIITNLINKFNRSSIDEGNNIEIKEGNILYIMSNTKNQRDEVENRNKTTINLGQCENELKSAYNISENNSLYIAKIEVKEEGMNIPKIEYEVYYPLYNNTLTKLNLSECKGKKIIVSIPVSISGDINKYNISSDYYNNICTKTTSENGADITLKDRKKQFIDNNMTLCEEDCELIEYNYTIEKAKCSCLVKIRLPLIDDIKFDKDKLYKSFTDIKNFANINLMKCYKSVFDFKSLKNNYGSFFYILLIIFFFIVMIAFYCKNYFSLITTIKLIKKAKIEMSKKEKKVNRFITNNNRNNILNINSNRNKKNDNKKSNEKNDNKSKNTATFKFNKISKKNNNNNMLSHRNNQNKNKLMNFMQVINNNTKKKIPLNKNKKLYRTNRKHSKNNNNKKIIISKKKYYQNY